MMDVKSDKEEQLSDKTCDNIAKEEGKLSNENSSSPESEGSEKVDDNIEKKDDKNEESSGPHTAEEKTGFLSKLGSFLTGKPSGDIPTADKANLVVNNENGVTSSSSDRSSLGIEENGTTITDNSTAHEAPTNLSSETEAEIPVGTTITDNSTAHEAPTNLSSETEAEIPVNSTTIKQDLEVYKEEELHSLEIENVTAMNFEEPLDSSQNEYDTLSSNNAASETDDNAPSLEDSEYETPEPEEDERDLSDEESNATDSIADSSGESQVLTEREEGDGQESEKKDKKLDHDEDKRDPQYIPKKGNFYEHDDRTSESEETPAKKPIQQKPSEKEGRWGHDLYDDDMQSPKSREELIDQYGYDIREEEGPPKARRRRRYGRGPNKYTRHWEEEEAYAKTRGSWRGRRGGGGRGFGHNASAPRKTEEEFPPLPVKDHSREDQPSEDMNTEHPELPKPETNAVVNSVQSRLNVRRVEVAEEEAPREHPSQQQKLRSEPQSKEHEARPHRHEAKTPPAQRRPFKQGSSEDRQKFSHSSVSTRGRGRGRTPPGIRGPHSGGSGSGGFAQQRLQQSRNPKQSMKTLEEAVFEEKGIPCAEFQALGRGRYPLQVLTMKQERYHQQQFAKMSSKCTAEEDIAMLSQHFSEAVINVDNKSIAPIPRAGSLPPVPPPPKTQQPQAAQIQQELKPHQAVQHQGKPHPPQIPSQQIPQPGRRPEEQPHRTANPNQQPHPQQQQQQHHHEKEAKSKRYSMQRQRSLPQGQIPPPNVSQPPPSQPPQHYIQDQYYQHGPPPPLEAPAPPQAPPPTSVPPPQFAPQQPAPYPPPEVPMMAFIPPPPGQFQPLYCPPPAYLPPAPIPVSTLPPQAPPPRPEVYQGAGGITYYNTQNQVSRPQVTSRRVKLAIPIVAPPPEGS